MFKKVLLFLAGAGIGSGVTFLIMRDKNERALQQERQNMLDEIEEFKKENSEETTDEVDPQKELKSIVNEFLYNNDKAQKREDEVNKESVDELINKYESTEGPYIISAEEFDEKGYETRYWYLYNDGVVVDENNDEITTEELSYSIGDCLNDYINGDDVVHIRNDFDETDYEIKKIDEDYIVEDENDEL